VGCAHQQVYKTTKWLLVSLSPDLDPVDDNGLCLVVNCVEDAVIAGPDPVTFLVCELFASVRSWIFRESKDISVNIVSKGWRYAGCLFLSLSFDNDFVTQDLSHFWRNFS